MSQHHGSIRRRGWLGVILWALLVILAIVLMSRGLWISTFFGFAPDPEFVEDARIGSVHLLGGSAASLGAALWSFRRGHPHWVTFLVAAPAVLIGGIALLMPYSLARHLAALVALPVAVAGIVGGLQDRGYRRVR
ncbi:hypothetical protein MB46_02285 [Arthrobacter alpinus]|uniref:hypothetical protein n=1 Tax=Arthrobacter alpinus TaxID=656366 RepID=UPI0006792CAB|nr:hypothetical protein [Arthrobacter alpinus]ALV44518.1 hypothetical protein MB46_02285 [Arthrobacter alpinus]